jgi:hypothetical protein|tara:strand:- start:240 stop:407 length:168 start_codon:yes stop_codon:yes gene_type:complete
VTKVWDRGGVKIVTETPAPFSTEMGPFAPAGSRRVVDKLTAIEMNLVQFRDNYYK